MFIEDLIGFLTSDTSLIESINGNLVSMELPPDFNANEEWVVFESTLSQNYSTFSTKNVAMKYDVVIQVVSKDILKINSISTALKELLKSYPNEWNIDANLIEDVDPDFSKERQVYYKTLRYSMLY